jgi:hypothetical protein
VSPAGCAVVGEALADHVPLQLREDGEDVELEAGERATIDVERARNDTEPDAEVVEQPSEQRPVREAAGESVESVHNDAMDLSFAACLS